MKDGRKLEKLEKYLQGKMSKSERSEFETLMQEDRSWQILLERYEIISEALEYQIEKELVDELVQQDTNLRLLHETRAIRKLSFTTPQLAGIAAAFLIIFVAIFWYGHSNFSNKALANKHYQLPLSAASRLPSAEMTDDFVEGLTAFSAGDWLVAIEHFKNVSPAAGNYAEAQFYLGHTYFNIGEYAASLEIFSALQEGNNVHAETIDWMIILSMLKASYDEEMILPKLDELMSNSNHAFFNSAAQLRQELQSFWRIF